MVAALFVSASLMKCRSTGKCLYRCSLSRFPKDPKLLWQNVLFCFFFLDKTELFYTSVVKYLGFALFLSHAPNSLTVFNTSLYAEVSPLIPHGFPVYNVYICVCKSVCEYAATLICINMHTQCSN